MWKILQNAEKNTEKAPSVREHEKLETFVMASIETLKRQKMTCVINEFLKCKILLRKTFFEKFLRKLSQFLIDNDL